MWPVVISVLRRYVPILTLPFACVVGAIGYQIEGWVSDKYTPASAPIIQQRNERLLQDPDSGTIQETHNPLKINLSPSLSS